MEKPENRLYSYKMARDTGFAPNPYFGVLTLATCKENLRRIIQPDNWIAGWTSKSLKKYSTDIGKERLVYLAKVSKKLTYAEYWEHYKEKRPVLTNPDDKAYYGDNIYEPATGGVPNPQQPDTFILHPNSSNKTEEKKAKDLSGEYVLVCEEFYYFGAKESLEIPAEIRPRIPQAQTRYGEITEDANRFIDYVRKNAGKFVKTNNIISNN